VDPAKEFTPKYLRESGRGDLVPLVALWQGYGSLKLTSERAETLRRNGIPIECLTDVDGMYFSRARLPVPQESPGRHQP
jgi:hypothetical protein